ncbi:MAG: preprotein translocase subunit YajC [Candidatus Rokuibacteriota bacterium]
MGIAHAADLAYAAALPPVNGGSSGMAIQILFFAAIFAIFYFLLIRPQQTQRKKREAMLSSIKRGDRVVTSSGLHGTVIGLNEQTVVLKVADQVKLEFDRSAIGRLASAPGEKGEA